MHYSETWDLDRIFPGGIRSQQLQTKTAQIRQQLLQAHTALREWQNAPDKIEPVHSITDQLQAIQAGLAQCEVFVVAIQSADASDRQAAPILNRLYQLDNQLDNLMNQFKKQLVKLDDVTFKQLLTQAALKPIAFKSDRNAASRGRTVRRPHRSTD